MKSISRPEINRIKMVRNISKRNRQIKLHNSQKVQANIMRLSKYRLPCRSKALVNCFPQKM